MVCPLLLCQQFCFTKTVMKKINFQNWTNTKPTDKPLLIYLRSSLNHRFPMQRNDNEELEMATLTNI